MPSSTRYGPSAPPELPSYLTLEDAELRKGDDLTKTVVALLPAYGVTVDNGHDEFRQRWGHLHPSSVDYCMRSQVYAYKKVEPTNKKSKKLTQIMELGHAIHDIVQTHLEQLGPVFAAQGIQYEFFRELPYVPEDDDLYRTLELGGTCDGGLRLWTDSWEQRGIVEIKSINKKGFDEAKLLGRPQIKHLKQAHIYAKRFNVPLIWLWYYCKENSEHQIFPWLFDQAIYEAALDYFLALRSFADANQLPEREESYFECGECVYRDGCAPTVLQRKIKYPTPKTTLKRRP